MARYYFGQVVLVSIDNGQGETKERPAIVLEFDDVKDELYVIAISKRQTHPIRYYHFQVHNSHQLDSKTGLSYPCWAKCNWVRIVSISRVQARMGFLPDDLLKPIVDMYDQIYADPDFTDWN